MPSQYVPRTLYKTARYLVRYSPEELINAGKWYEWPSQPNAANCIHVKGCPCSEVTDEWFDPDREHAPRQVHRMRLGLSICLRCAMIVVKEAELDT